MSIALLLLAADRSCRFGTFNKLLVHYRGMSLVGHAATSARDCEATLLFAAVSDRSVARFLTGFAPVWISRLQDPKTASLAKGFHAVSQTQAEACVIMHGDRPNITAEHLRSLIAKGQQYGLAACVDGDRHSLPAYVSRAHFAKLQSRNGHGQMAQLVESVPQDAMVSIGVPASTGRTMAAGRARL